MTTGAIKGAKVGISNSEVQTRHPAVMPSVSVITSSEREEETADFRNTYSPRSRYVCLFGFRRPNLITGLMANTRSATEDPRTCPGPDDRSIT